MTSIFNSMEKYPNNPEVLRNTQVEVFCSTLAKYNMHILPWKYTFYHALSDALNLYKPERIFHGRVNIVSSLTSGVFDDYIIKRTK